MRAYLSTYIHTEIHTYIHTYIHSSIHPSIHPYIHTSIHTYMHTYIHTYMHTYVHIYTHTCKVTYFKHICSTCTPTHILSYTMVVVISGFVCWKLVGVSGSEAYYDSNTSNPEDFVLFWSLNTGRFRILKLYAEP